MRCGRAVSLPSDAHLRSIERWPLGSLPCAAVALTPSSTGAGAQRAKCMAMAEAPAFVRAARECSEAASKPAGAGFTSSSANNLLIEVAAGSRSPPGTRALRLQSRDRHRRRGPRPRARASQGFPIRRIKDVLHSSSPDGDPGRHHLQVGNYARPADLARPISGAAPLGREPVGNSRLSLRVRSIVHRAVSAVCVTSSTLGTRLGRTAGHHARASRTAPTPWRKRTC